MIIVSLVFLPRDKIGRQEEVVVFSKKRKREHILHGMVVYPKMQVVGMKYSFF